MGAMPAWVPSGQCICLAHDLATLMQRHDANLLTSASFYNT